MLLSQEMFEPSFSLRMNKDFADLLKGTVWENISEHLYNALHRLKLDVDVYQKEDSVHNLLQYKIDLCKSILACLRNKSVFIGEEKLPEKQSEWARNYIKGSLIAEYYNLRMDESLISNEEVYHLFYAGYADDWLQNYYQNRQCDSVHHHGFLYRGMSGNDASDYLRDLWKEYRSKRTSGDWQKFSKEDMIDKIGFLEYVKSSLQKKRRPKNYALQNAVELFFERCYNESEITTYDNITYINNYIKEVWQLYHPHTNKEYLTIYRCLDYFNLINQELKDNWKNIDSKYQEQSYIKKIVSMLKEKYPIE